MHSSSVALFLLASFGSKLVSTHRDVQVETRSLAEIYAAAQHEDGRLNVAWGGDEPDQANYITALFESAFPKIKLNVTVNLSKYHDSLINRAYQEKDTQYADVTALQTLQDFDDWAEKDRLTLYKPATFDLFWPALRPDNGAYLPVMILSFGSFVYNKEQVSPDDVPTSYADVIDPKWKGKLILTYPNDDDAVCYVFSLIIQKYGYCWLDALIAQDVQWVRGTETPILLMTQNTTRILSFTTFPISPSFGISPPASDKFLIWPQTAAILASTTRPETSKLFMSWLASNQTQETFSNRSLSARKDIGPSAFAIKNASPTAFRKFMEDRKVVEQWRFQFETSIGTAQGVSPLLNGF